MKKRCPHCNGRTKCNCATCGKTIIIEKTEFVSGGRILKEEKQVEGMCQLCKGLGEVEK